MTRRKFLGFQFSSFKFSRFFFVLFLGITVLPLVILLLWNNYQLHKTDAMKQGRMIRFVAQDVAANCAENLAEGIEQAQRASRQIDSGDDAPQHYKEWLNAETAWPVASPQGEAFLKAHPEAWILSQQHPDDIAGDYFVENKQIKTFFLIPEGRGNGLLVIRPVAARAIFPHVPFRVEIYAGTALSPETLIARSPFEWHPPAFGHGEHGPHPFGGPHFGPHPRHDMGPKISENDTEGPPFAGAPPGEGPPHGFGPHEGGPRDVEHDRPMGPPREGPFGGAGSMEPGPLEPEKLVAEKTAELKNSEGRIIATIRVQALHSPPPIAQFQNLSNMLSLIILVAGLCSSVLAGLYIERNFIRPLLNLSDVAQKVKRGNLDIRIETAKVKQSDVRQTLENVNLMLDGLKEKDQLRNSFISNLTHDFRTPLIAEGRSLEILAQEFHKLGLEPQEKLALGILKNNEHLLLMVNELLETYQTEAEMFTLSLQPGSIPQLVTECFEQMIPLAEPRDIVLVQKFPENFPPMMMDVNVLKRVLINLIGNAIENIPRGSRIEIIGQQVALNMIEVRVRDNGQGISPEELQHVFDRYYAGSSDTRKLGSGLGLYICKLFVEAHHGTISVERVSDHYTDFILRLPIAGKGPPDDPSD